VRACVRVTLAAFFDMQWLILCNVFIYTHGSSKRLLLVTIPNPTEICVHLPVSYISVCD